MLPLLHMLLHRESSLIKSVRSKESWPRAESSVVMVMKVCASKVLKANPENTHTPQIMLLYIDGHYAGCTHTLNTHQCVIYDCPPVAKNKNNPFFSMHDLFVWSHKLSHIFKNTHHRFWKSRRWPNPCSLAQAMCSASLVIYCDAFCL